MSEHTTFSGTEYDVDQYTFIPEFQLRVLALMLQQRDWLSGFRQAVSPNFFENVVHRDIATLALEHFDKFGCPPDDVTLAEQLDSMLSEDKQKAQALELYSETLGQLLDEEIVDDGYLTEKVLRFAKHQAVKLAILKSAGELLPSESYDEIEILLREALSIDLDKNRAGATFGDNYERVIRTDFKTLRSPVPTGIPALDDALNGGLAKGESALVLADTTVGKTMIMVNMAGGALLAGRHAFYATLEDPEDMIADRMIRYLLAKTRKGLEETRDASVKRIAEILRLTRGRFSYKYFPPGKTKIAHIEEAVRQKEKETGRRIDIVFVDYADKLAPTRTRNNDTAEKAAAAEEIDALAKLDGVLRVVVTASQVNTDGANAKTVTHKHAYGARQKGSPAAVIIGLSQTEKELQAKPLPIARAYLDKNRYGKRGLTIKLAVDYARGRMAQYSVEVDPEQADGTP